MSLAQNKKLKQTLDALEGKLAKEEEHYDREMKAKQTLVLRKSEDFQEDCKYLVMQIKLACGRKNGTYRP